MLNQGAERGAIVSEGQGILLPVAFFIGGGKGSQCFTRQERGQSFDGPLPSVCGQGASLIPEIKKGVIQGMNKLDKFKKCGTECCFRQAMPARQS